LPGAHVPSPHEAAMQSLAHVIELSPSAGRQRPSPQKPGALLGQPTRTSAADIAAKNEKRI
jgi:hypothetical protein